MNRDTESLQDEMLSELQSAISSGEVIVESDDAKVIAELSKMFPLGLTAIDWHFVPEVRQFDAPKETKAIESMLPEIRLFLEEFARAAGLERDTWISVVGDAVTDVELRMTLGTLQKHAALVFGMPQNTYVVPLDRVWCFCYTFDDAMYFGRSPLKSEGQE